MKLRPEVLLPAIAVTPLDNPETSTGVELFVEKSYPQHFTAPEVSSAHVALALAVIAVTPLNPETSTGVVLCVVVPSPSCPRSFLPQHFTAPEESAQVWLEPAAMYCWAAT
jgi:hypothetical protein